MNTTSMHPSRRAALQAGLATLLLPVSPFARAQDRFPTRPIRIIVPLPPGGVADASVRMLANTMQPAVGQPVVIDNKPGGNFIVGMGALAQSPTDGYTLLHVNTPFLSSQALFKRFDVFKQLVPLAGLGETDMALTLGTSAPVKTVKDLIAYGRANPGKLSYVTPGYGSVEHLAVFNFCKANGIEAVNIPVKGGPDAVKSLIQGEGEFGIAPVPLVQQFVSTGKLTPLLVLNERRNPTMPDLPTPAEAGVKAPRCTVWGGICAPAGTPAAVLAYLEKAILEAARNPDLQAKLSAAGIVPAAQTGADFGKLMHDDQGWIAKAVQDADLKPN